MYVRDIFQICMMITSGELFTVIAGSIALCPTFKVTTVLERSKYSYIFSINLIQ